MTLTVVSIQTEAACSLCAHPSQRVQSRYSRTLADLPWAQRPVELQLQVRRFVCANPECPRKVFTERLPELVRPYARRTTRLHQQVALGFTLGGEAGARLCRTLGIAISPDTLLASVRRQPVPAAPTPRVLGVDDWSYRRGRQMGTILVDLERRCPVDLLPDCSEDSFAAWLEAHPGVEIISRDRGEIYAAGGRRGAPEAIHVADRWHLLKNLGDAVQTLMARHSPSLRQAAAQLPHDSPAPPAEGGQFLPLPVKRRPRRSTAPVVSAQRQRQLAMYEQVRTRISQGWSVAAIAQQLKLNRITMRKYRDMELFRDQRTTIRVAEAEPYRAYLEQRWAEGCTEAKQLWLELQAQGYRGGYKSVWQFTRHWELPETLAPAQPLPPATAPVRTPRQAMWLVMRSADKLSEEDSAYREQLLDQCSELALAETLVKEFQALLRTRQVEQLDAWVARASSSGIRELRRFALGLKQDEAAVRAALSCEWSNGQVEGQVTKLKLIKRQMYGRAKFDLLRARVLHRA